MNPSEELWQKYLKEADKLHKKKMIGKHDYVMLVHSLEARKRLMELTLGDDNVCVEGTVEEVLSSAKAHYLAEAEDRIRKTERRYSGLTRRIDEFLRGLTKRLSSIIYWSILLIWLLVLVGALVKTSPENVGSLRRIHELPVNELIRGIAFLILVVVTVLNIVFGLKLSNSARRMSNRSSRFIVQMIKNRFLPDN